MTQRRIFTRREFTGLTALAAMGLLMPSCRKEDESLPNYSQALVIGTGFGGVVTALRLGQAGIQTTVLERGKRWTLDPGGNTFSPNFPSDKRSTWMRTESVTPIGSLNSQFEKYAGVLERVDFQNINVYAGAAVGGGSIVYGGITIKPPQQYFTQMFPSELDYAVLDSIYFPRVLQMLNAVPIPSDLYNLSNYQFTRVAKQHAENAGLDTLLFDSAYDWNIVRDEFNGNIPRSALKGELLFGNNSGCKNSLDKNYIPLAESTGNVTIHPLHGVKGIGVDSDNRYYVEVEKIDEYGNVLETKTLVTDYLFLAAGSIGTTRLLIKAREKATLPDLNGEVGQGWGSNGNTMGARSNINESTGAMQSTPPIMAILDFNNPILPTFVEVAQLPLGLECNCLLQLAVSVDTATRGHFEYDATKDDVNLIWPANGNDMAKAAHEDAIARLNNANSGTLGHGLLPATTTGFTYHPLGGAVMGKACDLYGRVKGYNKLYVMDGALIPGSTGTNPSLTIAAIAERNIERIITEDFTS